MVIDRLFFLFLLIFLPTQLTRHFFFDFSLVKGLRVDYYAWQVSLTDILLGLMFLFWFIREKKRIFFKLKSSFKLKHWVFLFLFFTLNGLVSSAKPLFFLKLVKLIELFLFGFYIYQEKISLKLVGQGLLIGGFYSSLIAVGQFVKQASLGGWLWFLGERTFSVLTPGIAKAEIFGRLYLRSYATFPHPNVLAGFLALNLSFLLFLAKHLKKAVVFLLFGLFTVSLFLTFSRTGILAAWLAVVLSRFFFKEKKKNWFFILFFFFNVLFGWFLIGRFFSLLSGLEETTKQRLSLILVSFTLFFKNPLLGVGLNNFINNLPFLNLLQPVHNAYLLILAETGLFGFSFFGWLLVSAWQKLKNHPSFLKVIFCQIVILLFFDHYFYTLQQGQLLFTLFLSLMLKENNYV